MIERDATLPETEPRMREAPADPARQRAALDALLRAKGLRRYALFFTSRENLELPDDLEEMSGYVIDQNDRVFSFWMGADPVTGSAALVEWEQVEPKPRWIQRPEYRHARADVGLA